MVAIKQLKGNRAPREENIAVDMLKAYPTMTTGALDKLFN
jgi:hypothetical protein